MLTTGRRLCSLRKHTKTLKSRPEPKRTSTVRIDLIRFEFDRIFNERERVTLPITDVTMTFHFRRKRALCFTARRSAERGLCCRRRTRLSSDATATAGCAV